MIHVILSAAASVVNCSIKTLKKNCNNFFFFKCTTRVRNLGMDCSTIFYPDTIFDVKLEEVVVVSVDNYLLYSLENLTYLTT